MSTPTATPRTDDEETPLITNHRVSAETYKRMVDLARTLETELACEKTNRNHLIEKGAKLETELACLRAELVVEKNWVEHHSQHADDLIAENVKLRAEVERLKLDYEYDHKCLHEVRERCESWKQRAEKAEAALAEWSVLNLWGGTPEIIHEFIKGQQNRIHHCQDLEAECLEQARLLGMSGEREADLLGKLERLAKDKARPPWLEEKMWFVRANVMLHDEVPPYTVKTCDGIVHGATVRAAIDAAMKP